MDGLLREGGEATEDARCTITGTTLIFSRKVICHGTTRGISISIRR